MIDRKKLILPIAILLGFTVSIIIISIILMSLFPQDNRSDANLEDPQYVAIFQNKYQLEYSIGEASAKKAFSYIDEIITSNNELSSTESPVASDSDTNIYLKATLDETSFKKVNKSADDFHAYSFNIDLEDGRLYFIVARTDSSYGTEYIAVFVKNPSTNKSYFILNIDDSPLEETILDWGKSLGFTNPEIYTLD